MKDVVGFEGLYLVDDSGGVYSNRSGKMLAPKTDKDGYFEYCLCVNSVRTYRRAHRLVAECYLPPREGSNLQVNHIDCNKQNNHFSNLEWVTNQENITHAYLNGLCVGVRGEDNNLTKFSDWQVQTAIDTFVETCDIALAEKVSSLAQETIKGLISPKSGYHRFKLMDEKKWEIAVAMNRLLSPKCNPSVCVDTGKMYLSYGEVNRDLNLRHSQSMLPRIFNTNRSYGKMRWASVEKEQLLERIKVDEDFRKVVLELKLCV